MNASENKSPPSDRTAETLLAESGSRPSPPEEHLEQIRQAARAEWRRQYATTAEQVAGEEQPTQGANGGSVLSFDERPVASRQVDEQPNEPRSRTRLWLAAAGILALIGSGWWLSSGGPGADQGSPAASTQTVSAVVTRVVGQVEVLVEDDVARGTQPTESVVLGQPLMVGNVLATQLDGDAEVARLAIALTSGHSIRLDADTRLRLISGDRVELLRGKIFVASNRLSPGSSKAVTVMTSVGSVVDIGTQFEVALIDSPEGEESLRTRVREGEVLLRLTGEGGEDLGAASARATAGEQLIGDHQGVITRSPFAVFGEEWQWILAGSTPFPMDGRSGADLLHWLAAETGREVVYENTEAARAASSPLDAGDSALVQPEDAFDVLLTLGLIAHYEEGDIVVSLR